MPKGFIHKKSTDDYNSDVKYMTEEQKKAETARLATEAKAKEEKEKADADFEATIVDLSDEEKEAKRADREASNLENKPDYKAELEIERKRRVDAEKALSDKRFKDAERRRKAEEAGEDPDEEDEDDKPLTKKDLHGILAGERQAVIKETQADRIQSIATELSESEAEAQLIIEIHHNRTFPITLSLREQLEEAHAIANRKKLVSKNKELKRALGSRDTVSRDVGDGYRDPMAGTRPKLSAQDEASYKRAGFVFDTTSKLWKKKLPSGKFLVKDPRTKTTYTV